VRPAGLDRAFHKISINTKIIEFRLVDLSEIKFEVGASIEFELKQINRIGNLGPGGKTRWADLV
jgi:hypothetical protein